jgi:hypothetical protein
MIELKVKCVELAIESLRHREGCDNADLIERAKTIEAYIGPKGMDLGDMTVCEIQELASRLGGLAQADPAFVTDNGESIGI